ncbi:MAG: DNA gyrase inhibitor YacG [Phycisphaerales bacterium]|nr:DNA gyrase inhibitor YacG [Phycisphaerales bacterium]
MEPTRDSPNEPAPRGHACPICGAPVASETPSFPFCSARCRMADLGRWFGGRYTVSRDVTEEDLTEGP